MITPMPIITITPTTRATLRETSWRRWVVVSRGFRVATTYVYAPKRKAR